MSRKNTGMIMADKGKILNIGYFNIIISQEWAILPWKGAVSAAKKHHVNLLTFCGNQVKHQSGYNQQGNILYDIAKGAKLDGLIAWKGHLTGFLTDEEILYFLNQYPVPMVLIEGSFKNFPVIKYNDYHNMKKIVTHMIEVHGLKRIGFLGLVPGHEGFCNRIKAYKDTLEEYRIPFDESLVRPWNCWESLAKGSPLNDLLDAWLKEAFASGIEAIIGSCDPTAVWIVEHLQKLGIKVPQQMAVAGHDGFSLGTSSLPRLTTIQPYWEDLGTCAVDAVIKLINGISVPDTIYVSDRLIQAQSCGCMEENFYQAGEKAAGTNSDEASLRDFLTKIFNKDYNERLLREVTALGELLSQEISLVSQNKFLEKINALVMEHARENKSVIYWQDVVSYLLRTIQTGSYNEECKKKSLFLSNQARVLIGNAVNNQHICNQVKIIEHITTEQEIIKDLATIFEIAKIADLLAEGLPKLGIRGCLLALYENPKPYSYPDPAPEFSRLILAYNPNGRIHLKPGGKRCITSELIPEEFIDEYNSNNYLVLPLYFQNNQIGFIVFIANSDLLNGNTFSMLANQISSSLQGAFLMKDLITRDEQLKNTLSELQDNHIKLENTHVLLKENQNKLLIAEKMASLGRLTAGIAHEMNTPLASVRNAMSEMTNLINEYNISISSPEVTVDDHKAIIEDMLKTVAVTDRELARIAGFIRSIKSQTIATNNEKISSFNLTDVISGVLLYFHQLFIKEKITVITNATDFIELRGIPERFQQALTNIITNSIEALNGKKEAKIEVIIAEANEEVSIKIADNGCGIPEANLTKIFDPMFSTKPFGQKAGLGLTSVHDIIYAEFGGTITVESVLESGTVFSIIIPKRA